jgi:hypothetical protein
MLATMPMLISKPCRADMKGFVKFWSSQYNWIVKPAIYNDNIGLELTEGRIWELFLWKNGGPLSKLKEKTVRQNFVERRAELKGLPKNQNLKRSWIAFRRVARSGGSSGCTAGSMSVSQFTISTFIER